MHALIVAIALAAAAKETRNALEQRRSSADAPAAETPATSAASFLKEGKIVLLGEATHGYGASHRFLGQVIHEAGDSFDWLGLELGTELQPLMDSYLETGEGLSSLLAAGRYYDQAGMSEAATAYWQELRALNAKRRSQKRPPLRVLALDETVPDASAETFLGRDARMLERLRPALAGGAGILYMGAFHLSKAPVELPEPLVTILGVKPGTTQNTFGTLLSREQPGRTVHFWIQPDVLDADRGKIPAAWQPLYAVAPLLGSSTVLLPMNDPAVLAAMRQAGADAVSWKLPVSFDYFIRLGL